MDKRPRTLNFKASFSDRRLIFVLSVAAAVFCGCRVGPHYSVPSALPQAPPAEYKETTTPPVDAGQWKPAQPQDAMLRGKWWEIYNDSELNDLEDKVNIDNQNIKQYFENYMEARTLIAQARAQLFPTLSVAPGFQRSRSSSNLEHGAVTTTGATGATSGAGSQSTVWSLPLDASWQPDLFGKIRNQIREAQYSAQVSAADLENERLSEQASLATYLFEVRGQDALIDLYKRTVAADQQSLDLTRSLYNTGIDNEVSVVEAENTLENAQASQTNLAVARAQYEHAIAVLIGTNPSTFSIPAKPLDANPPPIPLGMPSQLLERRPDIAAAERQMAAANAQIGVATAAYFPSLNLTGSGGTESSLISQLFDWPSRFWSVGATLPETIFDAGLRRATVNQYVATYNADVASYRQTVLTAVQQVEDSIASLRILSNQMEQQHTAEQSAQKFVDLETARYKNGIDPYIDVVQAQTTLLSDQSTEATLRTEQMTASVQLIQALGGGWDRSDLPTPAQVSSKLSKTDTTIQK
ncbi:MAG TPA: efflux transporter outer membrane subunit [Terracidiphilus sp.]|jgi:NodT family efflux transporter outer membrane factor (OMF) lipoprotein|nr:efflux transporter outer membrane subunit [Terracidiphilus sp.]